MKRFYQERMNSVLCPLSWTDFNHGMKAINGNFSRSSDDFLGGKTRN